MMCDSGNRCFILKPVFHIETSYSDDIYCVIFIFIYLFIY